MTVNTRCGYTTVVSVGDGQCCDRRPQQWTWRTKLPSCSGWCWFSRSAHKVSYTDPAGVALGLGNHILNSATLDNYFEFPIFLTSRNRGITFSAAPFPDGVGDGLVGSVASHCRSYNLHTLVVMESRIRAIRARWYYAL